MAWAALALERKASRAAKNVKRARHLKGARQAFDPAAPACFSAAGVEAVGVGDGHCGREGEDDGSVRRGRAFAGGEGFAVVAEVAGGCRGIVRCWRRGRKAEEVLYRSRRTPEGAEGGRRRESGLGKRGPGVG